MFTAASTLVFALAAVKVSALSLPSLTLPRSASNSINNCSGNVAPLPADDTQYTEGYGPQIQGGQGWETWTYILPGIVNDSLSVFTWARGDSASPFSNPDGLATFSVIASHANFTATLQDKFIYTHDGDIQSFSIGDNRMVFNGSDGSFGSWNISVNIDNLELDVLTVPIPPDLPFGAGYHGVDSQLVDGYFTNIPTSRGHTDGRYKYPSGEIWQVHDVATIRHTYAEKPIQDLVSSYVRGTTFVILSAMHWFQAESVHHQKVETVEFCSGVSETDIPITYQGTNDPSIFTIANSGLNTTITFPGCDATENNQYELAGYPTTYRGSFVDSAGGKTDYYSTLTDASIWSQGQLYVGNNSQGILEVYTCAGDL